MAKRAANEERRGRDIHLWRVRTGLSTWSELVERLIPENGKSLFDIRDGENNYCPFALPGRSAIAALDVDARLCQQVGNLIERPRFVFQTENESGFFRELDFGRFQGGAGPLKVGDKESELARAGHFRRGKGLDVDASLTQDRSDLRHHARPALTADDQLCRGWHEKVPIGCR